MEKIIDSGTTKLVTTAIVLGIGGAMMQVPAPVQASSSCDPADFQICHDLASSAGGSVSDCSRGGDDLWCYYTDPVEGWIQVS